MDQNEGIFIRYMNDPPFQKLVNNWIASQAYKKLRASAAAAGGR
jgi:type I restriction enzyme R subunit